MATPQPPPETGPESNAIGQLLDWGTCSLAANSASPRLDTEVLMASLLHWPRSTVMAFPERNVPASLAGEFQATIRRRATGVPVAHLTGHREFYSLEFEVSTDTLVPRPETELLVDQLLERVSSLDEVAILDAGTGCGAIALAIKRQRPRSRVVALDASKAALDVASNNGFQLGLEVEWLLSDWFDTLGDRHFEFVVSNPPYVERDDPRLVEGDLRHEPRRALDGGLDGLDSIRTIIARAPRVLSARGTLLLEHGHNQARAVGELLRADGFRSIQTHRDLSGQDRVTLGRTP